MKGWSMVIHEPHKMGSHAAYDFDILWWDMPFLIWDAFCSSASPLCSRVTVCHGIHSYPWSSERELFQNVRCTLQELLASALPMLTRSCYKWVSLPLFFLVVEVQKSFSCNRLLRTRLEVHLLKAMAARHGASQQEPSSTWVSYISLFKRSGRIGLDVIWCYQISSTLTFFLETRCWVSSCFIVLQELSDLWLLPSNACGQEQLQHSGELWETWWGDANVALHCVPSWEIAFHSADSLNWLACVLPAIWQIEALTALKKHPWNSEVHCSWVLCTDLLVKGGCTFRG